MRSVPIAQVPGALAGQENIKDTSIKIRIPGAVHLFLDVKARIARVVAKGILHFLTFLPYIL